MQQAKSESDNPRPALCPALTALARMHNLAGDKNDAQSNTGLDRLLLHMHETERRGRQCDAVCHRERGDGSYETARAFYQNHQREDKQQVVNSAQYVFDAQAQIRARNVELRGRGARLKPWLRRVNQGGPFLTIQRLNADKNIGDRCLKADKLDALSGEAMRSGLNPAPFDQRIGQFLHDRVSSDSARRRAASGRRAGACRT